MPNSKVDSKGVFTLDGCHSDFTMASSGRSQEDVYRKKREKEENDFVARMLRPYSSFLVCYPSVVVAIIAFVVLVSIVLGVVEKAGAKPLPDFSNPIKGLEPRGTMLSSRGMALYNLQRYAGMLHGKNQTLRRDELAFSNFQKMKFSGNTLHLENYIEGLMLFFEHKRGENLFNHLDTICKWYKNRIESFPRYSEYISLVHHIPNYIAWMNNRTDCQTILKSDISNFTSLLKHCVGFYKDDSLLQCKRDIQKCDHIPHRCKSNANYRNQQDVVSLLYNTFHFLADTSLSRNPTFLKVTSTAGILKSQDGIQEGLFQPLYESELEDLSFSESNSIQIVAFTLWGFKYHIFSSMLYTQSLLAVSAIVFVIILTTFYSRSFFIGLMTLTSIVIAMIIAYFVYVRVFDIHFFPFLNINTIIFIIGIGADDVFVYTRIWEEAKGIYKIENVDDHVEYMIKWTTHSLRHALVAMLVTSLTTAAAFYANMSLSVTVAKCFGLYAGTAILVNYLLMVVFFPSVVVLHDRYFSKCMHACCPSICQKRPQIMDTGIFCKDDSITDYTTCEDVLKNMSRVICNTYLPNIICKFKYIFIVLLFGFGACGFIITFIKPGLRPPASADIQSFSSSSSLEQYDLFYKQKFEYDAAGGHYPQVLSFVFGVNAVDNGNYYNPADAGTLELMNELDLSSAQVWLIQFCRNLRMASFYSSSETCSELENNFATLTRPCPFFFRHKCCGRTLPLPRDDFRYCLELGLKQRKVDESSPLIFDKNLTLRAVVIPVKTKYIFSIDYLRNKDIVFALEEWTKKQMENATGSFNGWWYGDFRFYDLQESLYQGTKTSLAIAIAVSFVVILATSMNFLLSIYSILSIAFVISVTVGILILDGWRLNIVESAVFSVAAGLSADFTLHYSVAYRTSFFKDLRMSRVKYAISHVGSPIFMGAVTTFVGGLVMVPSTVRCYVQFGSFLMIVMFFSWLYSTFFFLPLCAAIGPTGYFAELRCQKESKPKFDLEMENNGLLPSQIKDCDNPVS